MSKIISIHSFRPGTGKSNITVNIATILAAAGQRIGIIDSHLSSPIIHTLFGLNKEAIRYSLNDFLWGSCPIEETAKDVTALIGPAIKGGLYLIPFATNPGEIDYDISLLSDSFQMLSNTLRLDVLIIDTQPGLEPETLPSIAFSDIQVVVLRPDEQDYQGTGVTIDIAQHLGIPTMMLIVNQVPAELNPATVRAKVEQAYGCEVIAVLPHSAELEALDNHGIFVAKYPDHRLTTLLTQAAATLTA